MPKHVKIIAEVGPNHNGSINQAINIIRKLSDSGVDAVKFQLANPLKVYSSDAFKAKYQQKNDPIDSIIEMSKRYQLSRKQHLILKKECEKNNLDYACSAFDLDSLIFLHKKINVSFFKVPSGEITTTDMLKYMGNSNLPIYLSTGMSTFSEINKALRFFKNKSNVTLMHCISSYPADKYLSNMNVIDELKRRFKTKIGFSDHTISNDCCLIAVAKGAEVIEKHVTLNKNASGPDHKASSTIEEFINLVKKIRSYEKILGNQLKVISKKELEIKNMARKSLISARKIKTGSKLKKSDICYKRPGTGISPFDESKFIGKKIKIDLDKDKVIYKHYF